MNVSGLRPWEWQQADAADLYQIASIQHAWESGYRKAAAEMEPPTDDPVGASGPPRRRR